MHVGPQVRPAFREVPRCLQDGSGRRDASSTTWTPWHTPMLVGLRAGDGRRRARLVETARFPGPCRSTRRSYWQSAAVRRQVQAGGAGAGRARPARVAVPARARPRPRRPLRQRSLAAIAVPERDLRAALTGSSGLHAILDVVLEGQKTVHPRRFSPTSSRIRSAGPSRTSTCVRFASTSRSRRRSSSSSSASPGGREGRRRPLARQP